MIHQLKGWLVRSAPLKPARNGTI